eukprot:m.134287 g.134287  ORF g.134287 m.134287 type:complete len:98 (+) comp15973_c0_seq7:799-1092(+)
MHLGFVWSETTTNEDLRSRYRSNPYTRFSGWQNMAFILLGPRMPSRLLARTPLEDCKPLNRQYKVLVPPPSVAQEDAIVVDTMTRLEHDGDESTNLV